MAEFDCHFLSEVFIAKDILNQKIYKVLSYDKDAFYVIDLGDILKKHLRWLKALPWVTPFYAVKRNDSRIIVKTYLRVPPERIICANLCKQVSQIKYDTKNRVQVMTLDSEVELLILRIATDDSKAVCLSVKFGATFKTSRILLEQMREVNFFFFLKIAGASESGRYYVVSAFMLAVNTIAKKLIESSEQTFMYYVNVGVYGSFSCILDNYAHARYYSTSLLGPICDGLDHIVESCDLSEMHVGNWMLFENEDVSPLPSSCAWEWDEAFPAACASARINV
ncbi:unnamed protein product [Nyctereutes procyonoides]|uniref:ornithine decarboxylase n=1 Tax=Nyctereutes procyonoides TaxID=34880 RepID=A0A811Y0H9_NYCPR|nr:unnamed protein product [Nyctereutes procyonoides]